MRGNCALQSKTLVHLLFPDSIYKVNVPISGHVAFIG